MMVVINIMDIVGLVGLALVAVLLVVAFVIDRVACVVRKRQQKQIDEAYNKEDAP